MNRWFPSPPLSIALLTVWLLLNQSLAPAHLLLGTFLAVVVPLLSRPLRPLAPVPFRKPVVMARLLASSLVEIVRSCFNVSRIILFTKPKGLNSQFIRVPLDLKNPHGLALLSCLINSTPGTVWVEILPGTHDLALHVFDLHDEQWWIDTIKTRYEQPLIEIFDY
ncbi:Na+/H+ antiporter subunit E [Billgrantia endophytica]|uniref:Na+/H+ antiporter subunit E n=1 Tax=Billgrantia endophytica TaxID=2033802 RepID=A0A2N7U1W4_9GAMM|nr:Na+/H+ antiporter subunit E [Halomonas endophytica]PMR74410.1 Na+/H+ antiporter subunit E [Halomonas endophytica]